MIERSKKEKILFSDVQQPNETTSSVPGMDGKSSI